MNGVATNSLRSTIRVTTHSNVIMMTTMTHDKVMRSFGGGRDARVGEANPGTKVAMVKTK